MQNAEKSERKYLQSPQKLQGGLNTVNPKRN